METEIKGFMQENNSIQKAVNVIFAAAGICEMSMTIIQVRVYNSGVWADITPVEDLAISGEEVLPILALKASDYIIETGSSIAKAAYIVKAEAPCLARILILFAIIIVKGRIR